MGLTNEHVGPKILAKIKIYVLTRAELLRFAMRYPVHIQKAGFYRKFGSTGIHSYVDPNKPNYRLQIKKGNIEKRCELYLHLTFQSVWTEIMYC